MIQVKRTKLVKRAKLGQETRTLRRLSILAKTQCPTMLTPCQFCFCCCRCYPRAFGSKLLNLWMNSKEEPEPSLRLGNIHCLHRCCMCLCCARIKYAPPPQLTDREVFETMCLGDAWHDAQLLEVWDYLWKHPKTNVPNSWLLTMERFDVEFRATIGQ